MNLAGNGYEIGKEFQRDEQLIRQRPHGGALADSPNAHGHEYERCDLPCPNPHCPYYGWRRTGEFTIGTPGWDCEAFLEALLSRNVTPIEAPDLRPQPRPRTVTTRA